MNHSASPSPSPSPYREPDPARTQEEKEREQELRREFLAWQRRIARELNTLSTQWGVVKASITEQDARFERLKRPWWRWIFQ